MNYDNEEDDETVGMEPQSTPETTLRAPDTWTRQVLERIRSGNHDIPPGMIAFHIQGRPSPILIELKDEIIIGRSAPDGDMLDLDLAVHHGAQQGVSRAHARIIIHENQVYIEDLASLNGTWIRNKRLPTGQPIPLHNADLIRMGQLVFFVHYSI